MGRSLQVPGAHDRYNFVAAYGLICTDFVFGSIHCRIQRRSTAGQVVPAECKAVAPVFGDPIRRSSCYIPTVPLDRAERELGCRRVLAAGPYVGLCGSIHIRHQAS